MSLSSSSSLKKNVSTAGTTGNTSLKSAGLVEELVLLYRLKLTSSRSLEGKTAAVLAQVYSSLLRCAFSFDILPKERASFFLRGGKTALPTCISFAGTRRG